GSVHQHQHRCKTPRTTHVPTGSRSRCREDQLGKSALRVLQVPWVGAHAGDPSLFRGRKKVNVDPSPASLKTDRSPPIARAMSLLMASTSPVPSWPLVSDRPT